MADLRQKNGDGVVIEHHDDHALRFQPAKQRAAIQGLGPARVRLEEDVALSERLEVEIGARLTADVGETVRGADEGRIGKREIAAGADIEGDQPRLDPRIDGKLVGERPDHPLDPGAQASPERIADVDIEHRFPGQLTSVLRPCFRNSSPDWIAISAWRG